MLSPIRKTSNRSHSRSLYLRSASWSEAESTYVSQVSLSTRPNFGALLFALVRPVLPNLVRDSSTATSCGCARWPSGSTLRCREGARRKSDPSRGQRYASGRTTHGVPTPSRISNGTGGSFPILHAHWVSPREKPASYRRILFFMQRREAWKPAA